MWLTVHIRDLVQRPLHCPPGFAELLSWKFVTQKTPHKFSALAHDQVHEQVNAMLKGDGGMVRITENQSALQHWMITGIEMTRMIKECEGSHTSTKSAKSKHHEQKPST